MSIIYLLLMVSIFVAIIFFIAFIVSVKRGQFDDVYTPSVRMLFDDEIVQENVAGASDNKADTATLDKKKQIQSTKKN